MPIKAHHGQPTLTLISDNRDVIDLALIHTNTVKPSILNESSERGEDFTAAALRLASSI